MAMAIDFAAMLREETKRASAPRPKASVPALTEAASAIAESHPVLPDMAISDRHSGDMESCALSSAPMSAVAVVPDFLTPRAQLLLQKCVMSPEYEASGRWVRLRGRQLLQFGGQPRPGPLMEGIESLPPWLERVVDALMVLGVFPEDHRPNHVLVNLYRRGEGILPHTDGPLYYPRTATVSFGSDAVMHFSPPVPTALIGSEAQRHLVAAKSFSVGLPRGSLVVFSGEAYEALHEIPAAVEDSVEGHCANAAALGWAVGTKVERDILRISLTIRHVPLARFSDSSGGGGISKPAEQSASASTSESTNG